MLKDISFCINAGEQIGLVGLNGAGKTTLTLLLCGLLKPTGGKIFYNGIDIEQFSRKEYISLFSNVFQDINLLHFTIGENITGSSDGETWKRAETVLKTAGFERDLGERGTAASIGKTFDERGIDFSGGEKLKIFSPSISAAKIGTPVSADKISFRVPVYRFTKKTPLMLARTLLGE